MTRRDLALMLLGASLLLALARHYPRSARSGRLVWLLSPSLN